ncbi:MAG: histidine phosphatase family protein [Chryseolinea sp.]
MPRYLYLLRHAESAEKQMGQHDRERELTQRGVREASLMGAYLLKENTKFDAVHCSSASRARSTAVVLAESMKIEGEKIDEHDELYDASTRTFFEFITQFNDDEQIILCIGHNPVISYLAESLTKSEIGEMPPAGLAVLKFASDQWKDILPGTAELQNYVYPQMLM